MRQSCWWFALAIGCKKDASDTGAEAVEVAPVSCVADAEVCASFSVEWSQEDADALCAELGGAEGECPAEALGTCQLDTGLSYHLYEITPVEAQDYCEWLGGEWVEPGEEPEEEA